MSSGDLSDDELDRTIPADEGRVGQTHGLARGDTIGRYVLLKVIGAGGMGKVYAAYDPELDRRLAIKLLHGDGPGSTRDSESAPSVRLQREAQAMARLTHPNVITVHDVGTHHGQVFVAMEYVEGETLTEWVERAHPDWRQALPVFLKAGRGLAAAHAAGLIHRDFKPDNVLLGSNGTVRVADFGLARGDEPERKEDDPEVVAQLEATASTLSSRLTVTGALMGTPAYMSPEQHLGAVVDARADQFAFCVALWEAVYRERPFAGESVAALAFAVVRGKLRDPPAGSGAPQWLRRALTRGLSRKAADRFPDMNALLAELEHGPKRRRQLAWGAGLVLLGGSAFGVGMLTDDPEAKDPCADQEAQLAGVYDEAVIERIEAAYAAVDADWAKPLQERVRKRMDDYASAWTAMAEESCRLTFVEKEQSGRMYDLRRACLDRHLAELGQVAEAIAAGDRDLLQESIDISYGLSPLENCADVDALTAAVPPPEDPVVRAQVEQLTVDLRAARIEMQAGKSEQALANSEALLAQARELGYAPLISDCLAFSAQTTQRKDRDAAEQLAFEAVRVGIEAGDYERAAFATSIMIRLIDHDGKPERNQELDRWFSTGLALAGAEDEAVRSGLYINHGQALLDREEFAQAKTEFEEAMRLRLEHFGEGHPRVADAHRALSMVSWSERKFEEAEVELRKAVAIYERHYGPDHPYLLSTLGNLGAIYVMTGRAADAVEVFERELRLETAEYGPDSRQVTRARSNLALVYGDLGRIDEALALLEEVRDWYVRERGPDHASTGEAWGNLGVLAMYGGNYDAAVEYALKSREVFMKDPGPESSRVASAHTNLCAARRLAHHPDQLASCEEALQVSRRNNGAEHLTTLEATVNLVRAEIDAGKLDRASNRLDQNWQALSQADDPGVVAEALFGRALTTSDPAEARRLAEQARDKVPPGMVGKHLRDDLEKFLAR